MSAKSIVEPSSSHLQDGDSLYANSKATLLYLFGSAIHWLILGTLLGAITSCKLIFPGFLDGIPFLTYGRLLPVAKDLLVYGWGTPAGLGIVIWLTLKLNQHPLPYTKVLSVAAHFWNIAIILGSLAILAGYGNSIEWLEYPNWASFMLFISFLLVAIWIMMMLGSLALSQLAISHWYFLAALSIFPWIYATANMLLTWGKIQASAQGAVFCWYGVNLVSIWLTFIALGIIYFLLPELTQRSSGKYYNQSLAKFGFWGLLLLTGWSSMRPLIGGPIPAWMVSISVVATLLLIVPVLAVTLNYYTILEGKSTLIFDPDEKDQSAASSAYYLPFFIIGIVAFLLWITLLIIESIPSVNPLFHFTSYTIGTTLLALLGFFSMVAAGAIYLALKDLLPQSFQVGTNPNLPVSCWCSQQPLTKLISLHLWPACVGVGMMITSMVLGGLIEGAALQDPAISFLNILSYNFPWHVLTTIAWLLQLVGYLFFGITFVRILMTAHFFSLKEKEESCCLSNNSGISSTAA